MKKIITLAMTLLLMLSFNNVSQAENIENETTDRSSSVIRVDIPNSDGTFTTLEGEKAQEWYDNAVKRSEKRIAREKKLLAPEKKENKLIIPFAISIVILSLIMKIILNVPSRKKR